MTNRRTFCLHLLLTGTILGGGTFWSRNAHAACVDSLGSEPLPGRAATLAEIDAMIIEVENTRAQFSMANDAFLREECGKIAAGIRESIDQQNAAIAIAEGEWDEAAQAAMLAFLGSAVAGVSVAMIVLSVSSPLWIGVVTGLSITAGTVPFALSLQRASETGNASDGVILGSSWVSGKMSLLTAVENGAEMLGKMAAWLGLALEVGQLIRAGANMVEVKAKLEKLLAVTQSLEQTTAAMDTKSLKR
jgi:hypothetical protein